MLNGGGIQFICQLLKKSLPLCSVIRKHPNFDESMRMKRGVHFFLNRCGQPIISNQHYRVQMVGFRAVDFAFGGSEMNDSHCVL